MSTPGTLTAHPVLTFKFCKFVSYYCTSPLYYCISACYLCRASSDTTYPHPFSFPLLHHPRSIPQLSNGFFFVTCILSPAVHICIHTSRQCFTHPDRTSVPFHTWDMLMRHGCHLPHINHWPHQRYSSATSQTLLPYHSFQTTPLPTTSSCMTYHINLLTPPLPYVLYIVPTVF